MLVRAYTGPRLLTITAPVHDNIDTSLTFKGATSTRLLQHTASIHLSSVAGATLLHDLLLNLYIDSTVPLDTDLTIRNCLHILFAPQAGIVNNVCILRGYKSTNSP